MPRILHHQLDPASRLVRLMFAEYGVPLELVEIKPWAREPQFLIGVLDYLSGDERLLTDFAREAGHDPAAVEAARIALGGGWERDVP